MFLPYNDLSRFNLSKELDLQGILTESIERNDFIGGKSVALFEADFKRFTNCEFVVGCANGTDALELAIQALELCPGDEVLLPAHTWISTAEAVISQGGIPVLVDTSQNSYLMDLSDLETKITSKTVGIIVVHFGGAIIDMRQVQEISSRNSLWIIEDCAQAVDARLLGTHVGNFGDFGTFSFYPGKNLGALGDAGCIVTNNERNAELVRKIANHGSLTKGKHELSGRNSRLDSIQAKVLMRKLAFLPEKTQRRRDLGKSYVEHISPIFKPEFNLNEFGSVFHLFMIQSNSRDALRDYLKTRGIETIVSYPNALSRFEFINKSKSHCPQAELNDQRILSIPLYPEMLPQEIDYLMSVLGDVAKETQLC
jgi:dTDP-4-amino-4,6-dideoxygalactose transaminase